MNDITDSLTHEKLRNQIPAMQCKPGCTDCCGPVPFSKWEWDQVQDKRQGKTIDCPYSLSGHCDIYKDRPMMCRLFGTADDSQLVCPHGCKPEKLLDKDQLFQIMKSYASMMSKTEES